MKIAIIGFGGMGQKIKEKALERGHEVPITIDSFNENADYKKVTDAPLNGVDIVLDFSSPNSVLDNIAAVAKEGVNMIVGTTGWYNDLDKVEKIVKENNIGLLWSANFSIGVNLFIKLIEDAADLFNNYDEYDIWATEVHHKNKIDSPSGTSKTIGEIILDKINRKNKLVYDKLDRKIEPDEIHFSSTRGGEVNFKHIINFDSAADTITLTHNARNRDGYVLGAIKASEWLLGKKGLFNMNNFLNNR